MKKQLTLIVGFITVLGLSSCTKEYISPSNVKTLTYTIAESDWAPVNGRTDIWQAELSFPEIDNYIHRQGTVLVDMSFDGVVYEPLTTVYEGIVYRYDYTVGSLLIEASYADGAGGVLPKPGSADIKVFLVDSELY